MKKVIRFMVAAAACGTVAMGFAAPSPQLVSDTSVHYLSAPGWYLGVGLGTGGMDTPKITSAMAQGQSHREDTGGILGSVYAGYLWPMEGTDSFKYGFEMGYMQYANNKYGVSSTTWDYTGYHFHLMGLAKYNIAGSGLYVLGKFGAAYAHQKFSCSTSTQDNVKKNKFLPKGEVGIGYDFNKLFDVGITYFRVFGNKPAAYSTTQPSSSLGKVAPVEGLMLNAVFHFAD